MAENKRRRRPFGVKVIITLQLFSIVTGLFVFAGEYLAFSYPELNVNLDLDFPMSGPEFWITNVQLAIVMVLSMISVVGLWRMQRWAWYLTMLELGFSMVVNISMYFNGNVNYIDMFLNVLMVFYLNQKDVQRAFSAASRGGRMNDLELLRQYEPVVHYTSGEHFFPCAVDGYVQRCSLWSLNKKKQRQQLLPAGDLDLQRLATFDDVPPGETLHLRIVDKPLDAVAYQRWRQLPDLPAFHAPGRFTRVGLVSRLASSLFNISARAWHCARWNGRRG
ncbi:MAG: hypothetical protein IPK16_28720 [Anaerolineales bacterium]|nr:hypothetical protein [Anaerolineales bacterium]